MTILSKIARLFLFFALIILHTNAYGLDKARVASLNYRLGKAAADSTKVYLLDSLAYEYCQNDLTLSLKYAERAFELAEKSGTSKVMAGSLFTLATINYYHGLWEISIRQYSRYLDIVKEQNNIKGIASAKINLGAIYLSMSNFIQAGKNFGEALKTYEQLTVQQPKMKFSSEIITIYNNLGIVNHNLRKYNQAIDFYSRGIKLAHSTPGVPDKIAMLLNNLGITYMELEKLPESFAAISEAMEIRVRNNDLTGQAQSCRSLAIYYAKLKEREKSSEFQKRGFTLSESIGNLYLVSYFAGELYKYYHEIHRPDSALKYHILLQESNEKLNFEASKNELTRLELTAQFKEKEKMRIMEQKRKELRYLLAGITLFLSLVIVTMMFLLSQSRVRRLKLEKENITLSSRNLELEKITLQQDLELRNKELTTNVMHQIQKNELVQEIIEKLLEHSRHLRNEEISIIHGIIKDLEKTQDSSVWNEFELRFNQVHNEFYEKINKISPDLSPNERKLCAFLRLNMTTKEIASITGQSIRSIEVARTRLRKKLNLTNSESGLIEFLSSV